MVLGADNGVWNFGVIVQRKRQYAAVIHDNEKRKPVSETFTCREAPLKVRRSGGSGSDVNIEILRIIITYGL